MMFAVKSELTGQKVPARRDLWQKEQEEAFMESKWKRQILSDVRFIKRWNESTVITLQSR